MATMATVSRVSKRDKARDEKAAICKAMEIESLSIGIAADVSSACSGIEIVGPFAAGAAAVSYAFKGGIDIARVAMDCADIPFDEIKEILETRFNDIDRKLDRNTEALREVRFMVSKTLKGIENIRIEMKQQFKKVLDSIRSSRIEPIVDKINDFVDSFDKEKKILDSFKKDQYITKLKEAGFLEDFQETKTPTADRLSVNINLIINGELAIPGSRNDDLAISALRALYYGTQAYLELMYFLIEKYTYLAEYHYQNRMFDLYNTYFDSIITNFNTFQTYLIGDGKDGLIPKVIKVFQTAIDEKLLPTDVKDQVAKQIESLNSIFNEVKNMTLSIIEDRPDNVKRIAFQLRLPSHGSWKEGKKVRYAVQFEKKGRHSKIGPWSDFFDLNGEANPTIEALPPAKDGSKRLIFRQIDDGNPQFVGKISSGKNKFIDISRDIYNAAGNIHANIALPEMELLLKYKEANIDEKFDDGRRAIHAAAKSDNVDLAKRFIIDPKKTDVNSQDDMGYAPIHVSVEVKSKNFTLMLLNNGANINIETNLGYTPLHLAVKLGYKGIIRSLIERPGIELNKKDKNGFTPLHFAVAHNHKVVKLLVSKTDTKVNEKSNLHLTPFHIAVMKDVNQEFNKTLMALLKSGRVNINEGNDNNMTALHFACFGDNSVAKIQFLLNLKDINVNAKTIDNNWTPLHLALTLRKDEVVFELLNAADINVDLPDSKGVTPLAAAVASGSSGVVKALIKKNANTKTVTKEGYTLLHAAALRKERELIASLPINDFDVNGKTTDGSTPLHLAISQNNTEPAKFLLENNADVTIWNKKDFTPMQLAALNDNTEILRCLLDHKADINTETHGKMTAFHFAASSGSVNALKFLQSNGAKVDAKANGGMTALHLAASEGKLDAILYLIENRADVNIVDDERNIYFYHAVRKGHLSVVEHLISNKRIKINSLDNNKNAGQVITLPIRKPIIYWAMRDAIKYGKLDMVEYFVGTLGYKVCNPLYNAAFFGEYKIVKYLVEEVFLDVDTSYDDDRPNDVPLLGAIFGSSLKIVKYLVGKGANIKASRHFVNAAAQIPRPEILQYIVDQGVDLKENSSSFPLIQTIAMNVYCFDCLKYVVENKLLNVNDKNYNGDTICHIIVKNMHPLAKKIISYLCSQGADVTIRNNDDKTAYEIAEENGTESLYPCLKPNTYNLYKRSTHSYVSSKNGNRLYRKAASQSENDSRYYKTKDLFYGRVGNIRSIPKSPRSTLAITGDTTYSAFPERYLNPNINVNSNLLLIDFFLKALTGQKYKSIDNVSISDFEAQEAAIDIIDRFGKVLKSFSNRPVEVHVDMSKIHSDVYKAIKRGTANEIPNILYSHVKSFADLNSKQIAELLS